MAICEARLCSHSGPITKRCNKADGYFVARPKGSPQIAHSCVATFAKDRAIACKMRLTVNNLGAS
jgi:hypothetical protein